MSNDLLFRSAPRTGAPWDLVFGADDIEAPAVVAIDLGSPTVTVTGVVDALTLTRHSSGSWREATPASSLASAPWSSMAQRTRETSAPWSQMALLQRMLSEPWREAAVLQAFNDALPWGQGVLTQRHGGDFWREGVFFDRRAALPWQQGVPVARTVVTLAGAPLFVERFVRKPWSDGTRLHRRNREPWRDATLRVSYGIPWPPFEPPEPPGHVCYTPNTLLLFRDGPATNNDLLFVCNDDMQTPSIVVPVRSVYMVTNTVTLRRLGSSVDLPAFGFSLSLDADSWTWGFNASLSGDALDAVSPDVDGTPAILVASVNGASYHVFVESRQRTRSFGRDAVAISGRGISAALDSPYDPTATFANTASRTAAQLMDDVLSDSGVPLGWTVDWQLDDWLVPAGAWSAQGSRMSALLGIAAAAGGYIQPHPTDQTLRVLHRYPVAPWEWGTLTPDIALPAAAVTIEGVEWVRKPAYNRVFVSGQSIGVRAEVTRDGTAGDIAAPSVVDALITATEAARQRGRAILSDTGSQARVQLRLPVLSETGIILPGKTVRYNDADGTDRFGIVRSTAVDAGFPEVWQSIGVETHV